MEDNEGDTNARTSRRHQKETLGRTRGLPGEGIQVASLLGKLHLWVSRVGPVNTNSYHLLNYCYIPDVVVSTF